MNNVTFEDAPFQIHPHRRSKKQQKTRATRGMAEKATSSSPEEAGACTPEQGKEHQELDLPVQPSGDSLSSAELPQGQSECLVCKLALRYPQQVTCCQWRFCGECIEKLLKDGEPCPNPSCKKADFSALPGDPDECLGLKSINKDEGVGELASDLEEHPNTKPSPESQLDGYPQDCGENVQRQEMDNHINQLTGVDCDYQVFGCEVRPARKDLPTHINESVADHMTMLAKSMCKEEKAKAQFMCKVEEDAKAQAGLSADNTKILKLQEKNVAELHRKFSEQQESIKNLQNESQKLKRCIAEDITAIKRQHFQHLCWGLTIALAIAAVGIGLASYRGDANLDSRINDTHSEAKALIVKLEDKLHDVEEDLNTKLEDKDSRIRDSFKSERKNTTESLAQNLNSLKGELEDKLYDVEDDLSAKFEDLQDLRDSFATLEVQLQAEIDRRFVVEFKMTDFEKNKTANAKLYSPPFYTHTHGYKMCIRVHANGIGDGTGTHVSVFLHLMPGIFDNDLKWPFQGDITVELVNQLNPMSNFKQKVQFSHSSSPKSVDKVTSGDKAAGAWGMPKFIAHSKLDDEQTQYLKHDSLIFRISKVTNVEGITV